MRPYTKYVLVQAPGWVLVGLLLLWLWPKTGWNPWIAVAGFAVWVVKDFLLYPFVRIAYRDSSPPGDQLVGMQGIARENLDPQGYVDVAGELWRAEIAPLETAIPSGSPVRVRAVSGLTLYVTLERRLEEQEGDQPPAR